MVYSGATPIMQLFSNILAPLVAGLFFLLFFIYFIIANPSKAASYRYFIAFLVAIAVFSLGRPLQLTLGPHPLPLIIVNFRVFILCAVIAPVIILASDVFSKRRRKRLEVAIIAVCVFLGAVYVVFNTLGTHASKELFQFAGIAAVDNDTPSGRPPYYGREVTIFVQMVIGLILLCFSGIKLIKLKLDAPPGGLLRNKIFLFDVGVVIFAASFIVGSYFKQWGIYYAASVLSAALFGASVLIDAKEVHGYYEKLVPFIKEDILDNVAFSELSADKLTQMLRCLGKGNLDTMVVIKLRVAGSEILRDLALMDQALAIVNRCLGAAFDEGRFLSLLLSNGRIGIALKLLTDPGDVARGAIWDALEEIRAEISRALKCGASIGIGRSYERIEGLRTSFREAQDAQDYAERVESAPIVHADNIHESDRRPSLYPVKEKERLLSLVKVGDVENSARAFEDFMSKFKPFVAERPEALKVRLYELVGSLIDAAILGGGDEERLNALVGGYFRDIEHANDAGLVEKWLSGAIGEIAALVARVYEKRSRSLVRNAMKYIDEHYREDLGYKDVAKEVFVSPSYFLSLFKRETGITFVDYLTELRIERAKSLLATTEKSISEIAFEIGFNNSNYFSSTFRRLAGMTAKEYRGVSSSPK
jgi:two-component system, response regulator YesN